MIWDHLKILTMETDCRSASFHSACCDATSFLPINPAVMRRNKLLLLLFLRQNTVTDGETGSSHSPTSQ